MNLQAIGEIVSEKNELVSNSTWAQTVESNFVIDFWPFIQSNQTKTCVNDVMKHSPTNLFKLGASFVPASLSMIALLVVGA